jgi:UDP-2,4-diacetamido-2,4,6-trideoxy-beta-L-altropyranose hydrolase
MDFILPFLAKAAPDALVVDSYLLVDDARQSLAALNIPMIYLDDGCGQKLPMAKMVINPSPIANIEAYKKTAPDATLLLGADYSYLSSHFWPENRSKDLPMRERDHILITFGGADPIQLTVAVTKGLMPLCEMGVHIDVVLPAAFEKMETLPQHRNIHWHQNLPSLAPLMQKVGLAVAQIGGTMGELATMGVPSIILTPNKEGEGFAAPHPDLAWYLPVPSHRVANADLLELLVTKAIHLWHDTVLRERLAKAGQKIVDGRGVRRISQTLMEHLS